MQILPDKGEDKMFIDICYPDKNEERFLAVASKIGTKQVCFVYDKIPKNKDLLPETFVAGTKQGSRILFTEDLNLSQKNVFYVYIPKKEDRKFNTPNRTITQVTLNGIKERGGCLGISISGLLDSGRYEEAEYIVRLAIKCKVELFCASFAKSPYDLVPEKGQLSIMRLLSRDTRASIAAIGLLGSRLK